MAYLIGREEAKAERKRKELVRVAPGWRGGGTLVPDRIGGAVGGVGGERKSEGAGVGEGEGGGGGLMELSGLDLSSPPPAPAPSSSSSTTENKA